MRKDEPRPPREYVPGAPIRPVAELARWLDDVAAAEPRRCVRLPVVLLWKGGDRQWIGDAFVAATVDAIAADVPALRLNDAALGISLVDRLRHACPSGQPGCALWLDGYVGAPADDDPRALHRFAVVAVGDGVDVAGGDQLCAYSAIESASS